MTERARKTSTHIEATAAAPEQEPVLANANLLELYGQDFSEFQDLDLGARMAGLDTSAFPSTGASLTDIRFWSQWRADWQGWF